ncbi:hypothetical protein [Vibrio sp. 10N.261.51.F12]|uniref:hypothetical protein n=1 Tax=Vibrio sp. 10N.261.51.F12 TaxID=3229679 RepID=UPI00354F81C9
MKKIFLTTALLSTCSVTTIAKENEVIDPSDLTRVYTQAAVFLDSNADIRMSGMMTGSWNEDIQFAGFVEGTFGNNDAKQQEQHKLGTNYQKGRAQYFQVHAMNNLLMPRIGVSTDIIHIDGEAGGQMDSGLDDTTLFSLGVIGLINPSYTGGAMIFPNIAYTVGEVFGEKADGLMLNLYLTQAIGDSGAFIQFSPEYFKTTGDVVEMESLKYSLFINAPINTDRKTWLMTRFEYGSADVILPNGHEDKADDELRIELGMKWFF